MRRMSYRVELKEGDEGYLLYNAETDWNTMPKKENLQYPSIRVKNVLVCGKVTTDIANCIEPCDFYEDDPLVDSDSLSLHSSFKANYVQILRDELPNWVLGVVRINKDGVTMAFFERKTGQEEDLYVKWVPWLKFMFEIDRADGSGIDSYTVEMSANEQDIGKDRCLRVTEQDACGRREIVFTSPYDQSDAADSNWKYTYVTEYR